MVCVVLHFSLAKIGQLTEKIPSLNVAGFLHNQFIQRVKCHFSARKKNKTRNNINVKVKPVVSTNLEIFTFFFLLGFSDLFLISS